MKEGRKDKRFMTEYAIVEYVKWNKSSWRLSS